MRVFLATSVLAAMAASPLAHAQEVVQIECGKDNTIYDEGYPVSNGAGHFLFAGNTNNGVKRRAIIWFDVAKHLPAGAVIEDVRVQLYMSKSQVGTRVNSLHRALSDWGEGASDAPNEEGMGADSEPGDASWFHTFFDSEFWNTPGGDFVAEPSASANVAGVGYYNWQSQGLIDDVRMWLDDPSQNFGWFIIGAEPPLGGSAKRYDSRDRTGVSREGITRPKLFVTYSIQVPADLTGDGLVNGEDLANLLANWGECVGCPADLDGNDEVNGADLAFLLANWT